MEKKTSFILYLNAFEQWKMLSDDQAGKLIKALFIYAETGERIVTDDGMLRMAFSFITAQMDRDNEKYAKTCEKRREAVNKRWNKNNTKNTIVCNSIQNITNNTDNDNDNDNDNENDNENENDNDTQGVCINIKGQPPDQEPTPGKADCFIKPSLDEVREYCALRKNNVDPERFIDYYDSVGWMIGQNLMKDWKAAVRHWEKGREKNIVRDRGDPDVEIYKDLINKF